MKPMDDASKENIGNLIKVGKKLLKMPVARTNMATGYYYYHEELTNGKEHLARKKKKKGKEHHTNGQALRHFAEMLSAERERRFEACSLGRKAMA